jgi:outer membrane receptor protein involved in Fe transport
MDYWDYQSRATWSLGDRDRLGIFAFGSHDRLAQRGTEQFASDFHRVDVRYDHDFGDTGHLRAATTAGWSSQGASPVYMDDLLLSARVEGETRLGDPFLMHFGGQLQLDAYSIPDGAGAIASSQVPSGAYPPPTNTTAGTYADVVWTPRPRIDITLGGRFDVFASRRSDGSASGAVPAVEPRFGARVKLAPGIAWLSSVGLAHQVPELRVGTAPPTSVAVPAFAEGATYLQTSSQASTGLELRLPAGLRLTATAFGSVTRHMSDLPDSCNEHITGTRQNPGQITYLCADEPVDGRAYGMELLLRRALTQKITGWLSYTLSRSTDTYTQPGASHTVPSQFDRTHVVSVIAAYDFGANWRAGTRVMAYSGTPYLQFSHDQRVAPYGDYRLPAFLRADVRLEKRWPLGEDRSVSLVFEVQNVTGAREENRLDCQPNATGTGTTCTVVSSPAVIIPSVGVEASF